jgi:NAD-dependent dihydropyrimidine dehydrogenase PreA subunit
MARELVLTPSKLELMTELAERLRRTHTLFAKSKTFSKLFLLELSYWTEGMPIKTYREMLHRFHLPDLPTRESSPMIVHSLKRDISDLGLHGLITLESVGMVVTLRSEGCLACMSCMEICPAGALSIDKTTNPCAISLDQALCNGVACRRCEPVCEPKVFHLTEFFGIKQAAAGQEA